MSEQSLSEVSIVIKARGIEEVKNQFRTFAKMVQDTQTRMTQMQKAQGEHEVAAVRETAKRKTQEVTRGAKARTSAEEQEYKKLLADVKRWEKEEIASVKAKNRAIEADEKASIGRRRDMVNKLGSTIKSNLGGLIGGAGRLGGIAAGLLGGAGVVDSIQSGIRTSARAKEISLNSGGEVSQRQVKETAESVALAEGFSSDDTLSAMDAFISKTGDVKMARTVMKELAQLANATGASLEDLGNAAGLAFNNDKTMGAEKLMGIMRNLAAQGRAGAVDMRDLATYLSRITNSASQFGGKDVTQNIAFLGAAAQISMAKGTSTSAAEATETVTSLPLDIAANKDKFAKIGVKTTDKNNKLVDPRKIIEDSIVKTNGDASKLLDVFGRRSFRAISGMNNAFVDAKAAHLKANPGDEKGAVKAGLAAMNELIDFYQKQELSKAQVQKESEERKQEADKKLIKAQEKLRIVLAERLLPAIIPLIDPLTELFVDLADFAKWLGGSELKIALLAAVALIAASLAGAGTALAIFTTAALAAEWALSSADNKNKEVRANQGQLDTQSYNARKIMRAVNGSGEDLDDKQKETLAQTMSTAERNKKHAKAVLKDIEEKGGPDLSEKFLEVKKNAENELLQADEVIKQLKEFGQYNNFTKGKDETETAILDDEARAKRYAKWLGGSGDHPDAEESPEQAAARQADEEMVRSIKSQREALDKNTEALKNLNLTPPDGAPPPTEPGKGGGRSYVFNRP